MSKVEKRLREGEEEEEYDFFSGRKLRKKLYKNLNHLYASPLFLRIRIFIEEEVFRKHAGTPGETWQLRSIEKIEGNADTIIVEIRYLDCHKDNVARIIFSAKDCTSSLNCEICGVSGPVKMPSRYCKGMRPGMEYMKKSETPIYYIQAIKDQFRPLLGSSEGLCYSQKCEKLPKDEILAAIDHPGSGFVAEMFLKLCQFKILYWKKKFYYYKSPQWEEDEEGNLLVCLINTHVADQIRWLLYDTAYEIDDRPGPVANLCQLKERLEKMFKKYSEIKITSPIITEIKTRAKFTGSWNGRENYEAGWPKDGKFPK